MIYRCHCKHLTLCGARDCAIRPIERLYTLCKNPKRYSAAWWAAIREARDGALIVLRAGPGDCTPTPEDAEFWAKYLLRVEQISGKLDRGFLRFIESRDYGGLRGTA
jgi:hypothetical protein